MWWLTHDGITYVTMSNITYDFSYVIIFGITFNSYLFILDTSSVFGRFYTIPINVYTHSMFCTSKKLFHSLTHDMSYTECQHQFKFHRYVLHNVSCISSIYFDVNLLQWPKFTYFKLFPIEKSYILRLHHIRDGHLLGHEKSVFVHNSPVCYEPYSGIMF